MTNETKELTKMTRNILWLLLTIVEWATFLGTFLLLWFMMSVYRIELWSTTFFVVFGIAVFLGWLNGVLFKFLKGK